MILLDGRWLVAATEKGLRARFDRANANCPPLTLVAPVVSAKQALRECVKGCFDLIRKPRYPERFERL
jgi:hypothetical protein